MYSALETAPFRATGKLLQATRETTFTEQKNLARYKSDGRKHDGWF